jgi:hypothetical protein
MFKLIILHGKGVPFSLDHYKLKHGETLVVKDLSPHTSIQELKQRIVTLNDKYKTWFTEKSTLMYGGEVLDRPLRTLQEYKITSNCQLTFAHWYTFNVPLSKYKLKLFKRAFDNYDADGSGEIDSHELHTLVNELGMYRTKEHCNELVANVDLDGSGEICFEEFCLMMVQIMQEDCGASFEAMEGLQLGTQDEKELRERDDGALVMWDPGYPGSKNSSAKSPQEQYGAVTYVEETNSYVFSSDLLAAHNSKQPMDQHDLQANSSP